MRGLEYIVRSSIPNQLWNYWVSMDVEIVHAKQNDTQETVKHFLIDVATKSNNANRFKHSPPMSPSISNCQIKQLLSFQEVDCFCPDHMHKTPSTWLNVRVLANL